MIFRRDDQTPPVRLFPASRARANLARGAYREISDDTDAIPLELTTGLHARTPIVCSPPNIPGTYLSGFIDRTEDIMRIHECPIPDVSQAARCAMLLAEDEGLDIYDVMEDPDRAVA